VATGESVRPEAWAKALTVLLAVTLIGPVYTAELPVGVEPSRV
jgi:hypothetical protein